MASDSAMSTNLAAAVVALAGIPFGVLVGQHRARGLHHGAADEVLGGDQLEAGGLPEGFASDGIGDLRIGFAQSLLADD